jgi:hypothetical protein
MKLSPFAYFFNRLLAIKQSRTGSEGKLSKFGTKVIMSHSAAPGLGLKPAFP